MGIGAVTGIGGVGGGFGIDDGAGFLALGASPANLRLNTGISNFQFTSPDFPSSAISPISPSLSGLEFNLPPIGAIGGLSSGRLDLGVNGLVTGSSPSFAVSGPEPELVQLHPSIAPALNLWGGSQAPSQAAFQQLFGGTHTAAAPTAGTFDRLLNWGMTLHGNGSLSAKAQIAEANQVAGDRSQPWYVHQVALEDLAELRKGYVPSQLLTGAISGAATLLKLVTDPEARTNAYAGVKSNLMTAWNDKLGTLEKGLNSVLNRAANEPDDLAVDLFNPGKYLTALKGAAGAGAILGTIDKSSWKLYSVAPEKALFDIKTGVVSDSGIYPKSPFARILDASYFDKRGRVDFSVPDGRYIYAITPSTGEIVFSQEYSPLHRVDIQVIPNFGNPIQVGNAGYRIYHPELLGGFDPKTPGAGMIDFKQRQIIGVDLNTGHFKVGEGALPVVQEVFGEIIPANAFHPRFPGVSPWNPRRD